MKKFFYVILFSLVFTATPGQSFAAPAVSNVRAEEIRGQDARIKWKTDVLADSFVRYGTESGRYTVTSSVRCSSSTLVLEHCIRLTDLLANTIFYYQVESTDASARKTVSAEYQFISALTNDTIVPIAPLDLYAVLLANEQDVELRWRERAVDELDYRIFRRIKGLSDWEPTIFASANIDTYIFKNHPNGAYEYRVAACNRFGCSDYSNIAPLTKGQVPAMTPPATPTPTTTPSSTPEVKPEPKIEPVPAATPQAREIPAAPEPAPVFTRDLRIGIRGSDVATLQTVLIKEGVYRQALVTGYYGVFTTQAVRNLQGKYGFSRSGRVDAALRQKLNELAAVHAISQVKGESIRVLQKGDRGLDVLLLQEKLVKAGVLGHWLITGYYGDLTARAVAAYQR